MPSREEENQIGTIWLIPLPLSCGSCVLPIPQTPFTERGLSYPLGKLRYKLAILYERVRVIYTLLHKKSPEVGAYVF